MTEQRGRGRPKKSQDAPVSQSPDEIEPTITKRGRGRPKTSDGPGKPRRSSTPVARSSSPAKRAPKRKSAPADHDAPKRVLRQRESEKIVEIMDERKFHGKIQFKVVWGDENKTPSWEPEEKVPEELIEAFRAEPDSDVEYEVEKILQMRKKKGSIEYLVRWAGFTSEYDTWEPEANMPKNKVKEFKKRQNSSDDEDDLASDDPDKEFTVEKIIMRRGNGKRRLYRVSWEGYSSKFNSWEPEENLAGAKKMLRDFNKMEDEKEAKRAEKEYEVERIVDEKLLYKRPHFLVKWKNYHSGHNTWQDEESLADCQDALEKWAITKEKRVERRKETAERREKKKEEEKAKREESKLAKAAEKAAKTSKTTTA